MITLLHISDLHIGETPRWLGSFEARSPTRNPTKIPSRRGHDERVAWDLSNEWARIQQRYPETRIIMTGDFTREGGGVEFGCAHRYLHSYWLINPAALNPLRIGLGAGGDRALTIPGNHDFWNGTVMLSPIIGRAVLDAHFWPLAWLHIIPDTDNKFELHVVGLNSCSGLGRVSITQAIAQGAINNGHPETIEQSLLRAKSEAQSRNRPIIRIVIAHHPLDHLTPNSQRILRAWLNRNSVSALLTGHTHTTRFPEPKSRPRFDLCCGTTLQAGTRDKLPGLEPNCFYLHGIHLDSSGTRFVWQTWRYWHTGQRWITAPQPAWTSTPFVGLNL